AGGAHPRGPGARPRAPGRPRREPTRSAGDSPRSGARSRQSPVARHQSPVVSRQSSAGVVSVETVDWRRVTDGGRLMTARSLAVLLFLFCIAVPSSATTIVPADLGALSHDAIAIVRGRVAAVDGRWTDDRRTIETIVTLDVDEYLKGDLGRAVQFRVPGGLLGRFRSIVVGAPRFAVDDRVIVFLGSRGPMIPFIVGFSQGIYRVVRDGS